MPKRDRTVQLLLVLLILVLGAGAYLTRRPDSPVLRAAEGWPWVGPWAERWRERFDPPDPIAPSAGADRAGSGPTYIVVGPGGEESVELDLEAIEAHPWVWVPEGTPVREAADPEAAIVHRTEALTNLAMLRRDDDWFQVLVGHRRGWVHLPDYVDDDGSPPLGRDPEPPGPLGGRAPRPEVVERARVHFSGGVREIRIGPYAALTDVEDQALLEICDRFAAGLESIYVSRYGLQPVGQPAELIVVYRDEEDYASLRAQSRRISRLPASGHVGEGMVAIFRGDQPTEQVAGTLIHELVHLLNRRGLGPALPPWLDEGLADELGQSEIDVDGMLHPGRLGGAVVRSADRLTLSGGRAAAMQLRAAIEDGDMMPLEQLVGLDWQGFVGSERRELHYAQSSFLLRFLLSGGDPELAAGLRAFLRDVAAGGSVEGDSLRRSLDVEWDELEARFHAWVRLLADSVEQVGST